VGKLADQFGDIWTGEQEEDHFYHNWEEEPSDAHWVRERRFQDEWWTEVAPELDWKEDQIESMFPLPYNATMDLQSAAEKCNSVGEKVMILVEVEFWVESWQAFDDNGYKIGERKYVRQRSYGSHEEYVGSEVNETEERGESRVGKKVGEPQRKSWRFVCASVERTPSSQLFYSPEVLMTSMQGGRERSGKHLPRGAEGVLRNEVEMIETYRQVFHREYYLTPFNCFLPRIGEDHTSNECVSRTKCVEWFPCVVHYSFRDDEEPFRGVEHDGAHKYGICDARNRCVGDCTRGADFYTCNQSCVPWTACKSWEFNDGICDPWGRCMPEELFSSDDTFSFANRLLFGNTSDQGSLKLFPPAQAETKSDASEVTEMYSGMLREEIFHNIIPSNSEKVQSDDEQGDLLLEDTELGSSGFCILYLLLTHQWKAIPSTCTVDSLAPSSSDLSLEYESGLAPRAIKVITWVLYMLLGLWWMACLVGVCAFVLLTLVVSATMWYRKLWRICLWFVTT